MGRPKLRVAVLTSSRADYGIYSSLIRKLFADDFFSVDIVAFGTHLSKKHGYTISQILADGFPVKHRIHSAPAGDSPEAVSLSMGKTIFGLSRVWKKENYDLIFALGDRYEMFAAVASSVPFTIPAAHLHGGETTTGAIDNVFRHSISLMSKYHFVCAEPYAEKLRELTATKENIFNVGALSIDNLSSLKLLSKEEFKHNFSIDLSKPSILITFHPETVNYKMNEKFTDELTGALNELNRYQFVITMPNADTMGNLIRKKLNSFISKNKNAVGVESFGTIGYLSCMKHCAFMLGNTSSGFVEASYFPKYVINLGERQNGRIITPNIFSCSLNKKEILSTVKKIEKAPVLSQISVYGKGDTGKKIIAILKKVLN